VALLSTQFMNLEVASAGDRRGRAWIDPTMENLLITFSQHRARPAMIWRPTACFLAALARYGYDHLRLER
jgi:hypothetical protein